MDAAWPEPAGRACGLGPHPPTRTEILIPQAAMQPEPPHQQLGATAHISAVPAGAHSGWHASQAPWTPSPASEGFTAAAKSASRGESWQLPAAGWQRLAAAGTMPLRVAAPPARALGAPAMLPPGSISTAWTTDDIVLPPAAYHLDQAPGSTPGSMRGSFDGGSVRRSSFDGAPPMPFLSAPLATVDRAAYAHASCEFAGSPCWRTGSSGSGSCSGIISPATHAPPLHPPPRPAPTEPACMSPLSCQQLLLADAAADEKMHAIDAQVDQLLAQRALVQRRLLQQRTLLEGEPCAMPAAAPGTVLAPATTQPQLLCTSMAPAPGTFLAAPGQPAGTCGFVNSGGGAGTTLLAQGLTVEELLEAQQLRQVLRSQLMRLLPPA